ncbi:MAG: PAS domain-containing protein [Rhodobacteraceae bacterium]|nr:PAS domain-containing protein [Paracoccaceae bacterium]
MLAASRLMANAKSHRLFERLYFSFEFGEPVASPWDVDMERNRDQAEIQTDPGIGDQAWSSVLQAMDRTDAELADDRKEQEVRNAEVTNVRHFLGSIMTSISDFLIVADRVGKIEEARASFCRLLGLDASGLSHWQLCDFFEGEAWDRSNGTVDRVISMRREQTVSVDLKTPGGPDPVEFRVSPRLDTRRKCTWVVMTGRTATGGFTPARTRVNTSWIGCEALRLVRHMWSW